jgi:hypothetical protein
VLAAVTLFVAATGLLARSIKPRASRQLAGPDTATLAWSGGTGTARPSKPTGPTATPPSAGPPPGAPRAAAVTSSDACAVQLARIHGELQQKWALYLRLARLDGLSAHSGVARGPFSDAADCEQEAARARSEVEALRPRRQRALPAHVQFERTTGSNPTGTTDVRALLQRLLGPNARTWGVACRADICRLQPPQEPGLSIHELHQRPEFTERLSGSWSGPDGALYHRLRGPTARTEEELTREETWRTLEIATNAAIKRCAQRHTSADRADATILFPGPGELNADGVAGRPSVRLRGPSADQPFGRCLREAITSALASVPLPPGLPAREVVYSLHGSGFTP